MQLRSKAAARRFQWAAFRGRCRRNLVSGLVLLAVVGAYGIWAGQRFSRRGADLSAFDQPLVRAAARMVPPPVHLRTIQPSNSRELYLATVVSDQQDVMFGLSVLLLRLIVTMTLGGLGLVLLTAGATEWEVRSEAVLIARGDARSGALDDPRDGA